MTPFPDLSSPQRDRLFEGFGPPVTRSRPGRWQWVDVAGTVAGSGTPTGFAINFAPEPDAKMLVIYFEAGGACWSYMTSRLHVRGLGVVMHLPGFGHREWKVSPISLLARQMWIFNRRDETNPFRHAHFVYFPYSTGDIFVGDSTRTLQGPLRCLKTTIHFRGQRNVRRYLQRLVPTFPDMERIYLVGASAGGYGASFSWWLANEAWRTTPVDVIADAAPPIFLPRHMFDRWISTWGSQLPDDCPECGHGLRQILEYAERRYLGPERYALITTREDMVMSLFFGMRPKRFGSYVDRMCSDFFDDQDRYPGTAHANYFVMQGSNHTVFPTNRVRRARVDGMSLERWLGQMVNHDPDWRSWHVRAEPAKVR